MLTLIVHNQLLCKSATSNQHRKRITYVAPCGKLHATKKSAKFLGVNPKFHRLVKYAMINASRKMTHWWTAKSFASWLFITFQATSPNHWDELFNHRPRWYVDATLSPEFRPKPTSCSMSFRWVRFRCSERPRSPDRWFSATSGVVESAYRYKFPWSGRPNSPHWCW